MRKLIVAALLITFSVATAFSQTKVTQTREASGFSGIDLKMWATVNVTQGDRYSVQVSAPQEWLERITTDVDDNELEISYDSKEWSKEFMKNKPDVIVNVTLPKINELNIHGSGAIKMQNSIITDNLSLDINGSGEIYVPELKAGKCEIGIYGSGSINVDKAVAENIEQEIQGSGSIRCGTIMGTMVSINLAGSGDVKVENVSSQKLEVDAQGSGDVKIEKGVCTDIAFSTSGSGSIVGSGVVGKTVSASVAGSGSISVGVLDTLQASIAGSGSVVYKGSPSNISKSINGSGSVRQM